MEIDIKTLGLVLVILWSVYSLFKDSPLFASLKESLLGGFTNKKKVVIDTKTVVVSNREDYDIVKTLLDLRSGFDPEHPIYKQLTKTATMFIQTKDEVDVEVDGERTNA